MSLSLLRLACKALQRPACLLSLLLEPAVVRHHRWFLGVPTVACPEVWILLRELTTHKGLVLLLLVLRVLLLMVGLSVLLVMMIRLRVMRRALGVISAALVVQSWPLIALVAFSEVGRVVLSLPSFSLLRRVLGSVIIFVSVFVHF